MRGWKSELEIFTHFASDIWHIWEKLVPQRFIKHFWGWLQADSQPISLFILNLLSGFDHLCAKFFLAITINLITFKTQRQKHIPGIISLIRQLVFKLSQVLSDFNISVFFFTIVCSLQGHREKYHFKDRFVSMWVCIEMVVKSYNEIDQLTQVQLVDFHHVFLNIFVNHHGHTTLLHQKVSTYTRIWEKFYANKKENLPV